MSDIPPITNALGMYWRQPKTENILLDETHCVMSESDFDQLYEYSTSIPSGKYEGKMWKAEKSDGWYLVWYDFHTDPKLMAIKYRKILIV